jgi:hypothetical protein
MLMMAGTENCKMSLPMLEVPMELILEFFSASLIWRPNVEIMGLAFKGWVGKRDFPRVCAAYLFDVQRVTGCPLAGGALTVIIWAGFYNF